MTDQGERAPRQESAASISGRSAAIDAAFAEFPDFGEDGPVSAEPDASAAETPAGDDRKESASTEAGTTKEAPEVDESKRPVEGQKKEATASKDALEPPKHWPADRRAAFETLSDDAKKIVLDRNKEANIAVTKSQQEAAQYRKTHEAITQVFSDDHRRQMQAAGMDEIGAIRYLLQQHEALNHDPVAYVKAIISRTGIQPEQVYGAAAQPSQAANQEDPAQEWRDPQLTALEQKLLKLEQAETDRQRYAEDSKRSEQQRQKRWFSEQCAAFENAIGDDGTPKYPHLPAVMKDVVRLVTTDPATAEAMRSRPLETLEQAYNNALYLNPEIRQSLESERIEAEIARRMRESEAASAVTKARAAVTRKASLGANGQAKPRTNMSREEAINKAMADLGIA